MKNYDPDSQWGKHTIKVSFQRWDYKGFVTFRKGGNCKGFNFDYRKVKETNDLEKKSKQEYVIEMTQEQIEQTLKTRNEADKTIEELTEEMKKIDQKIEENREELEYKTGEEKEEYERANQRLESQKQKYEDKIKELNETKKSLEEKRQKLIEKNREAQSEKTN
ncbi:hypothetical protein CYQ73_10690 [Enterococcus faecium]|nr:DUF5406 family protein [Enterococcus faecium]RXU75007.1 hypothetical protein CYQ85_11120 [Enterococcus faecium]RXW62160.1 hypothetical protein CYQ73_10690 [Enterococcus faecium]